MDIINQSEIYFNDPLDYDQKAVVKCWTKDTSELLKSFSEKVLGNLEWKDESIQRCINDFSETKCVSKSKLIQPLRVSMCGALSGPSMVDLMLVLGKETCIRRIKNAIKIL